MKRSGSYFGGHFLWLLFTASLVSPVSAQEENTGDVRQDIDYSEHFRVFTADGRPATLEEIVSRMADAEVVLVGETHTDPVGHWIEARLFQEALALAGVLHGDESNISAGSGRPVALSLEMFERDVQEIVDEYLADLITEDQFKASARPWEHYDADYRPMVELAKASGVPVLAANAPRRYVNRVSRMGPAALDALSDRAKESLPPLPFPAPTQAYRDEWNALMANMVMEPQCPVPEEAEEEESPGGHPPAGPPPGMPAHMGSFMENGLQAQTLWDASMAHAITTFLEGNPGGLVVHMVGGFHVKNFTGTPEKVEFYRPGTRSLVVHMDIEDDFRTFDPEEHGGRGDFVILTDKSLDLNIERNCGDQGGGPR